MTCYVATETEGYHIHRIRLQVYMYTVHYLTTNCGLYTATTAHGVLPMVYLAWLSLIGELHIHSQTENSH